MDVAKCGEERRMVLFADAHSIWTEGRLTKEHPHYAKVAVKAQRHMDGHLSVWRIPRLILRFGGHGGVGQARESGQFHFALTPPAELGLRRDYGEAHHISVGHVGPAVLVVAHTQRGAHVRLISARSASRKERKAYHEYTQNGA